MTVWLAAAAAMVALLIPLGLAAMRGSPLDRLVVLELASATSTTALILLAEGFDRDVYFELAVVMAVLSFAGNLVYARFLEQGV
jgi:multicomponent Na+:H+ antiporter subunit F